MRFAILAAFVLRAMGSLTFEGLYLEWGRRISCSKIKLLHGISIAACYEECLNRGRCLSFGYMARAKVCELCANDDTTWTSVQSPKGYVLSRKRHWNLSLLSTVCDNCPDTHVCHTNGDCKITECVEPVRPNVRAITLGNVYEVSSHVIHTCAAGTDMQEGAGNTECEAKGTWTPVTLTACSVYLGCFEDRLVRSLTYGPYSSRAMTTELCREMCRSKLGHVTMFFFATQYGKHCSCGTSYPKYTRLPESECTMRCSGNQSQICGRDWRMSVYQTFQ